MEFYICVCDNFKMKKTASILSIIILTAVISSFTSSSQSQSGFGPWRTTTCFKGLDYSVKRASYNESAKKYEWWVRFRNRYKVNASFDCVLKESTVISAKCTDRVTVRANSEGGGIWFLVADANAVKVFVDALRFGKDDWGTRYEPCDN